jgi:flagellar biogenesis protein FliO
MNGLFGLELPTSVNFIIAFVVVLALIGAAAWLVRRFGVTRLESGGRNRQPRLAVIDSAAVDGRRKLVIIRRDNVEHLLMIGGPTDVVVETNILRAAAAVARDAPAVRVNGGETLPRAMPLPDATHWPLQPEPAAATPAPATRPERVRTDDGAQWPIQNEPVPSAAPPVRAQRDALASLAADLSQPTAAPAAAPRPAAPARTAAVKAAPPVQIQASTPAPTQAPAVQIDSQAAAAAADQNLANMAHQLEAALRRPAAEAAELKRVEPKLVQRSEPAPRPAPKPAAAVAAASVAPAAAQQKQPFDSLEQEMASLLGRPGKS